MGIFEKLSAFGKKEKVMAKPAAQAKSLVVTLDNGIVNYNKAANRHLVATDIITLLNQQGIIDDAFANNPATRQTLEQMVLAYLTNDVVVKCTENSAKFFASNQGLRLDRENNTKDVTSGYFAGILPNGSHSNQLNLSFSIFGENPTSYLPYESKNRNISFLERDFSLAPDSIFGAMSMTAGVLNKKPIVRCISSTITPHLDKNGQITFFKEELNEKNGERIAIARTPYFNAKVEGAIYDSNGRYVIAKEKETTFPLHLSGEYQHIYYSNPKTPLLYKKDDMSPVSTPVGKQTGLLNLQYIRDYVKTFNPYVSRKNFALKSTKPTQLGE